MLVKNKNFLLAVEVLFALAVAYLAFVVTKSNAKEVWEFNNSDIFHEFVYSQEIVRGTNPYKKILSGDLLINRKYATLFPLYYYFLSLISGFSNNTFEIFIGNFRNILFISLLVSSLFLYLFFRREKRVSLGMLAVLLFIFNRWTINTLSDAKQDFLALALLISSLYFFKSKIRTSYFLYGLSLGIKHLGIFILPFYLAPVVFRDRKVKNFYLDCVFLLMPVLIPSIYFLLDDYKSFLFSMLFSFTRKPATTSVSFGFEKLLVLYNIGVENNKVFYYLIPRAPLVVVYLMNVVLLFYKRMPLFFFPLSAMFSFIAFNPVLFDQYLTWITPLFYLCLIDIYAGRKDGNK